MIVLVVQLSLLCVSSPATEVSNPPAREKGETISANKERGKGEEYIPFYVC